MPAFASQDQPRKQWDIVVPLYSVAALGAARPTVQ